MANNQNNAAPNGPWRAGRPSFKAFYPEIFLLTLITIAFIAIAVKLSCSTIRKTREKSNNQPTALRLDAPLLVPLAFADDSSIDKTSETEAPAPESPTNAPEAAPAPIQEVEPAANVDSMTSVPETKASERDASKQSKGESPWVKVVWIWIVCLIVPVILWIWRGIVWIYAVFGIYYELRVDPDNPRATTFLTTHGIFNKSTDSLHIGSIKDIQSRQSFLQKYLMGGVGTIILFTNDLTSDKVEMKNMADPSRVFNAFDTLRRHFWSRGGMQLHGGGGADDDGAFSEQVGG